MATKKKTVKNLILIVEDSTIQAELLRRLLVKEGYDVSVASDGRNGIIKAGKQKPSLIISDVDMPVMDGYEMSFTLKNDAILSDIPIILLTRLTSVSDLLKGCEANAEYYITKPYDNEHLLSKIKDAINTSPRRKQKERSEEVSVFISGKSYVITSSIQQTWNLLLSTYENALLQNSELSATKSILEKTNKLLEDQYTKLQYSKEMFKTLVETIPDIIYQIDPKGRFVFLNDAIRFLGYDPDKLIGKHFSKIILPSDLIHVSRSEALKENSNKETGAEKSPKLFDERRTGERITKSLEVRILRKASKKEEYVSMEIISSNLMIAEINSSGMYKKDSKSRKETFVGTVGVMRDMTERKKTDMKINQMNAEIFRLESAALQKQINITEKKFNDLIKTSIDTIIILNAAEMITLFNMSAEIFFGYKQNEVYGKPFSSILSEEFQKIYIQKFKRYRKTRDPRVVEGTSEFSITTRDGSVKQAEMSVSVSQTDNSYLYICIIRDITERKRTEKEVEIGVDRLQKSLYGTIHALATTAETRDPYTAGHQQRVATLARAIAVELEYTEDEIEGIYIAGVIHDLGKMCVPAEILSKPGRITEDEFNIIKNHPQVGYDILKEIEFPWPIAEIVRQHHEYMDGSGYPQGLSGEDIHKEAKVLCVADVVEAMASHRPYRPSLGMDVALEEIKKNAGIRFDSKVVNTCVKLIEEKGFEFDREPGKM